MADIAGIESGEPKPDPKAKAAPEAPKPKADATPAKPATTAKTPTPPAKPEAPKVEGIDQVRSRLKEVQENEKAVRAELETLRKEREELSKRRFITPEVEAEIERNKTEAAELRKQLSEVSYERSEKFHKDYVRPFNAAKQQALEYAKSYPVLVDDDGTTRAATDQDFYKVAQAPRAERIAIARRLFGDNGFSVANDANRLEEMRVAANNAIREHNETSAQKEADEAAAKAEALRKIESQFDQLSKISREGLAKEAPEYFAEDPNDPESTEAWKKGQQFWDAATARMKVAPVDEIAALNEVIRAKVAYFDRAQYQRKKDSARIAELEAELAKVRGGDPGNVGERTDPPKTEETGGGTAKLLDKFRAMEG